ncbi:TPA: hypothetical protein ACX6RO_001782 [Photobacterium damselae]
MLTIADINSEHKEQFDRCFNHTIEVLMWFNSNNQPQGLLNDITSFTDSIEKGLGLNSFEYFVEVAYCILKTYRDKNKDQLTKVLFGYLGIRPNGAIKPSASKAAKYLGVKQLSHVAQATNLPLRTLQKWFKSRTITFFALIAYSQ